MILTEAKETRSTVAEPWNGQDASLDIKPGCCLSWRGEMYCIPPAATVCPIRALCNKALLNYTFISPVHYAVSLTTV
jgi:hypothetical protein